MLRPRSQPSWASLLLLRVQESPWLRYSRVWTGDVGAHADYGIDDRYEMMNACDLPYIVQYMTIKIVLNYTYLCTVLHMNWVTSLADWLDQG